MSFYASPRRPLSYQAYLASGAVSGAEDDVSAVVGAGTAAFSSDTHSAWRAISIGVTTGALTYLVTRMIEKFLK